MYQLMFIRFKNIYFVYRKLIVVKKQFPPLLYVFDFRNPILTLNRPQLIDF